MFVFSFPDARVVIHVVKLVVSMNTGSGYNHTKGLKYTNPHVHDLIHK